MTIGTTGPSHRIVPPRSVLVRRRLRSTLIICTLIPVILSAVYMWSMWDPTHYLRKVPLAVVNTDTGVDRDGKHQNYGAEVVHGLLDKHYLNFQEVSAEDAQTGLLKGNYLFTVTIPQDFSSDIVTVVDSQPRQPKVNISYNDYNGTNGTILTSGLVPQVQAGVAASISETYAKQVLDGLGQLSDGLTRAAAGAQQLDAGAAKLHDGTTRGVDGAAKLADGAGTLSQGLTTLDGKIGELGAGVDKLAAGGAKVSDGSHKLSDGAGRLVDGTAKLGDGAAQIDAGVGQLTGMVLPLLDQAQTVAPTLRPVADTLRSLGMTEQADQISGLADKLDANNPQNMAAQLTRLKDGTAQLSDNLNNPEAPYLSGVLTLQQGLGTLSEGADTLSAGLTKLQASTGKLKDGTAKLDAGAGRLAEGTSTLADGTRQLNDGTRQLTEGTGTLSGELGKGAARAPKIDSPSLSARQIAVPIAFDETNHHAVQAVVSVDDPTVKTLSGGASMLFILVFGSVLMGVVAIAMPLRRSVAHGFAEKTAINTLILFGLAGLSVVTGWAPMAWLPLAGVLIAMAAAGAAVFGLCRRVGGRLGGGVAAAAVFAIGLFSFGGVWPLATTPAALRAFHMVSPLSYARFAFTRATDGIYDPTFWLGLGGLAGFGIAALVIAWWVQRRRATA